MIHFLVCPKWLHCPVVSVVSGNLPLYPCSKHCTYSSLHCAGAWLHAYSVGRPVKGCCLWLSWSIWVGFRTLSFVIVESGSPTLYIKLLPFYIFSIVTPNSRKVMHLLVSKRTLQPLWCFRPPISSGQRHRQEVMSSWESMQTARELTGILRRQWRERKNLGTGRSL